MPIRVELKDPVTSYTITLTAYAAGEKTSKIDFKFVKIQDSSSSSSSLTTTAAA